MCSVNIIWSTLKQDRADECEVGECGYNSFPSRSFIQLIAANIWVFNPAVQNWAGNITIKAVVDLRENLADQLVYY